MKKKTNRIITYSLVVIMAVFACFCITSKKATTLKDKVSVYAAPSDLVTIQFKDVKMYNTIKYRVGEAKINSSDDTNMTITMTEENIASITELAIFNSGINDISGIEKFTNLQRLDVGNHYSSNSNKISDISALSSLTNLKSLTLLETQVSDISALGNLTNLTELYLWNNQISDITPLSNLTNLTQLSLYDNQISDISVLSNLTNLTELSLAYNQISDIAPLSGLNVFENNQVHFYGNKSTNTVSRKEYKIPSILTLRDKDCYINALTSSKDLTLVNCTLSEDGTSVILNPGLKKGDTVIIKFNDFVSIGPPVAGIEHTLTVDDVYIDPPIPTITYSKTEQTNESVTATISFNKEGVTILNNDGNNTYTFDLNGEFTFEYIDENGNTGNAKAIINNIDKEMPVGNVTYETTDEGVVATITFDKEGVTILNNDGKNTYTFKENGEFTFEFVDMAGNKGSVIATVNNIVKDTENSNNNENVNTGDSIVYFIIALVMSVVCISIITIYKMKNKINV